MNQKSPCLRLSCFEVCGALLFIQKAGPYFLNLPTFDVKIKSKLILVIHVNRFKFLAFSFHSLLEAHVTEFYFLEKAMKFSSEMSMDATL